ncbi:hypothetical protein MiSe_42970 [Microseira wollei NIES-4236]|uniref:Transposase n=1 Tax=Microseira wollei NIES-4236 TaxID=2530354 RepID=A0AAV3X9M4_9CYAN|nr:hypothetical protein MiSe_42970 [Microseira wollei NIES-4236]
MEKAVTLEEALRLAMQLELVDKVKTRSHSVKQRDRSFQQTASAQLMLSNGQPAFLRC